MVRNLQMKHKIATQYHNHHMGHTPEMVSTIFNGRRLVALGGSLVQSDNPDKDWQEPAEFLTSHLKTTLGNEWFDEESKKPPERRHIVLNWAIDGKTERAYNRIKLTRSFALIISRLFEDIVYVSGYNHQNNRHNLF
jgi:hypothetical protein